MSSGAPLVSIVIASLDQWRHAPESVLSTKSAYLGPLEIIIVVDAGAEPRTRRQLEDVARRLSDERTRFEILVAEPGGRASTLNRGLARATGEFVQLLDCGDLLLPEKLDDQILHFRIADALDVSVTDCIFSNESVDSFSRNRNLADCRYDLGDFAAKWDRGFRLPLSCALFRRAIFVTRTFDERPEIDAEWLFWSRLAAAGGRIAYLGGPGAVCREDAAGLRRPLPDAAGCWLATAREIDRMAHPTLPNFLAEAVEWHSRRFDGATSADDVSAKEPARAEEVRSPPLARAAPRAFTRSAAPRISVVIPVHEHFEYLERCFASVAAQCDEDVEVVVVDDGSRDPRVRPLLERFAGELDAEVVFQSENRGVAATLNEAVARAGGVHVAFLDCDDTLEPNALRKALAYLEANPDCDYLFTDRHDISEDDRILRLARYGGYRDDRITGEFRRDLLNGMVASHLKVVRRASITRAGGFETATSGVQDWVMALKIAEFGSFGYLPEPLYNYRVHSRTVTQSDMRGQVMRANSVRRRFAQRYFRERGVDGRFGGGARSDLAPRVLAPVEISPRELGDLWSRRPVFVDASAEVTEADIWRLREFNSYFDKILWSAPEIHAALLGWVWSPEILART